MIAASVTAQCDRLRPRAQQTPPGDWLPVVIAGCECGIARPEVACTLAAKLPRLQLSSGRLLFDDASLSVEQRSELLNEAALHLREAGLLRGWRDEQLDLRAAPDGPVVAALERAAFRALGLTNRAVQLNGWSADGALWIARRAPSKQIDPGLLDNLVGGMVTTGETEHAALAREAMEEAGLDLTALAVARGRRFVERRRVAEGWQSEIVQIFDVTVPSGARLANQDGEVASIQLLPLAAVIGAIERDEFTLEAALATLDGVARREMLALPEGLFL